MPLPPARCSTRRWGSTRHHGRTRRPHRTRRACPASATTGAPSRTERMSSRNPRQGILPFPRRRSEDRRTPRAPPRRSTPGRSPPSRVPSSRSRWTWPQAVRAVRLLIVLVLPTARACQEHLPLTFSLPQSKRNPTTVEAAPTRVALVPPAVRAVEPSLVSSPTTGTPLVVATNGSVALWRTCSGRRRARGHRSSRPRLRPCCLGTLPPWQAAAEALLPFLDVAHPTVFSLAVPTCRPSRTLHFIPASTTVALAPFLDPLVQRNLFRKRRTCRLL